MSTAAATVNQVTSCHSVNRSGLSKLQRQILAMAEAGRARNLTRADLWQAEIVADVLGLPAPPLCRFESPPARYFHTEAIGRQRYNCAKAAVSRAVKRLADRGLIEVHYCGVRGAAALRLVDGGAA